MARRIASARPTVLLELMMSKVDVVSRVAASEATDQCDTKIARAPA
jgi:hypothetical protein